MEPYPLGGSLGSTSAPVLGVKDALRSVKDALRIFSSENIPNSEFMVSGRIRALRNHGGVLFATLIEGGETLQVVMERSLVGERR